MQHLCQVICFLTGSALPKPARLSKRQERKEMWSLQPSPFGKIYRNKKPFYLVSISLSASFLSPVSISQSLSSSGWNRSLKDSIHIQSPSDGLETVSQERDYEKKKKGKKVAPGGHGNTFQNGIQVLLGFNQLSALHSDSFRLPSWTLLYHYSPPEKQLDQPWAQKPSILPSYTWHLWLPAMVRGSNFFKRKDILAGRDLSCGREAEKMILPNSSHHIPVWDNDRATHNMEWSHYYFSRKLSGLSHKCSGSDFPWTLLASLFVNMWVIEPQSQTIQCICSQFAAVNTAPPRIPKAPHAFRVVRVKLRSNHLCSDIDSL